MKAIDAGNLVLLDVRTPEEYNDGFIEGARNLDYFGSGFEKALLAFDKEIPVYVYCASGGRSEAAAEDLIKQGLKEVYNLAGGIEAWQDEKLPVTHP
jgi:rhodanese-related sulfurtransferase